MRQNDFGGTAGGKLIKDRTFYFVNYEQLNLSQPQPYPVNSISVPSLAMREDTSINATLRSMLNAYPTPNGGDNPTTVGLSYWNGATYDYNYSKSWSAKIDHTIRPSLQTFFRYSQSPSNSEDYGDITDSVGVMNSQTYTFGLTQTIGSKFANSFRSNYSTNGGKYKYTLISRGNPLPDVSALSGGRSDSLTLWSFLITNPISYGTETSNTQRTWNLIDNVNLQWKDHAISGGFDYRYLFPHIQPMAFKMNVSFASWDMLKANTATYVNVSQQDGTTLITRNFSAFLQDSWRIGTRWSADYGVRWDVNPAPYGTRPTDLRYVTGWENPATMHFAPAGTPAYATKYSNLAPRVGASYLLNQKRDRETVLRGEWGIYFDQQSALALAAANQYPHYRAQIYPTYPDTTPVPYPFNSSITQDVPPVSVTSPYPPGQTFSTTINSDQSPYVQQWNVAVQQALTWSSVLTVSYVVSAH